MVESVGSFESVGDAPASHAQAPVALSPRAPGTTTAAEPVADASLLREILSRLDLLTTAVGTMDSKLTAVSTSVDLALARIDILEAQVQSWNELPSETGG